MDERRRAKKLEKNFLYIGSRSGVSREIARSPQRLSSGPREYYSGKFRCSKTYTEFKRYKEGCITLRKFKVVRKFWVEHCKNSQRNKIRRKRLVKEVHRTKH